jgi:cytochrome c oxidase assembly protein subunit 15
MVVIIYGAFTRLTDAGLGCPDWPGCYGFLKVPQNPESIAIAAQAFPERPLEPHKAWNEMIHRYLAGTLGLLIAAIFISSFISKIRQPRILASLLLCLVICQAALGAWTVTMSLLPIVVLAHLLGGFTLYSLLALYWMQLSPEFRVAEPALNTLKPLAIGAAIIVMIQIGLGGWTAANYAALACIELPICEAGWVSRMAFDEAFDLHLGYSDYEYGVMSSEARQTVHVFHRIGAFITLGIVSWFAVVLYRRSQTKVMQRFAVAIGVVLLLQFLLGLLNVVLHLPLVNAVAHNFVGANLLMLMVVVLYQLYRPVGKEA